MWGKIKLNSSDNNKKKTTTTRKKIKRILNTRERDARRKRLFDRSVAFTKVKIMVANCHLARERAREKEREGQTDRQRQRQTDRERACN